MWSGGSYLKRECTICHKVFVIQPIDKRKRRFLGCWIVVVSRRILFFDLTSFVSLIYEDCFFSCLGFWLCVPVAGSRAASSVLSWFITKESGICFISIILTE